MKTKIKLTLTTLALTLMCASAGATTLEAQVDKINGSDQVNPEVQPALVELQRGDIADNEVKVVTPYVMFAPEYQAMVDQLLPKLMAPYSVEDKATPYDETNDCLLVASYDKGSAAPACQIVLESGEYLPVKRHHSRFFIKTPEGLLGPFATGNLMGAPVDKPYARRVDIPAVNFGRVDENMSGSGG